MWRLVLFFWDLGNYRTDAWRRVSFNAICTNNFINAVIQEIYKDVVESSSYMCDGPVLFQSPKNSCVWKTASKLRNLDKYPWQIWCWLTGTYLPVHSNCFLWWNEICFVRLSGSRPRNCHTTNQREQTEETGGRSCQGRPSEFTKMILSFFLTRKEIPSIHFKFFY